MRGAPMRGAPMRGAPIGRAALRNTARPRFRSRISKTLSRPPRHRLSSSNHMRQYTSNRMLELHLGQPLVERRPLLKRHPLLERPLRHPLVERPLCTDEAGKRQSPPTPPPPQVSSFSSLCHTHSTLANLSRTHFPPCINDSSSFSTPSHGTVAVTSAAPQTPPMTRALSNRAYASTGPPPVAAAPTEHYQLARCETARCLVELLLVPHNFNFHTQLKQCISALASPGGLEGRPTEEYKAMRSHLAVRLDESLLKQRSLCAHGVPMSGGALREGTMPGWVETLFDVPIALEALSEVTPPPPL